MKCKVCDSRLEDMRDREDRIHFWCNTCKKAYSETVEDELDRLRKEERIWKRVCQFERERWNKYRTAFQGLINAEERAHHRDLMELGGENNE